MRASQRASHHELPLRRRLAAQHDLAVSVRRALTPTRVLESESFWAQAAYVRDSPFTMHDSEGHVCLVDSEDAAELLAGDAFDRLILAKVQRWKREVDAGKLARLRSRAVEAERLRVESLAAAVERAQGTTAPQHGTVQRSIRVAMSALTIGRYKRDSGGVPAHAETVLHAPSNLSDAASQPGTLPSAPTLRLLEQQARGLHVTLHRPQSQQDFGASSDSAPVSSSAVALAATAQGDVEDAAADARLAHALAELTAYPQLSREDLSCCFFRQSDLDAAYRLLNMDASPTVNRASFVTAARLMAGARKSTQTALGSYGGVSGAVSLLAAAAFWIVYAIVVLAIYQVSFFAVFVPLSSLILGLGFALGPAVQRFVDCLIFVLVVAPFDVGDRVQLSGVAGNATLTVLQSAFDILAYDRTCCEHACVIYL